MPLDNAPNPTQVNPFNGRSDDTVAAAAFDKLWQAGALDSQNPKEAAELQARRAEEKGEPAQPVEEPPSTAPEDAQKTTAAPESDPEYVNLDDYLTKAGLERESFYSLPVRVKDKDVPLADLLKRAEVEHDVEGERTALTERQKAFEAESAQRKQLLDQRLQAAEALGGMAYQELVREYQSIDWKTLSQNEPGRAALLQTQFQQRNAEIQGALQQLQQAQAQKAQELEAQRAENLKAEGQKLLKAVPEWRDEKVFAAERDTMRSYGNKMGFSKEELDAISDHRYMRVLRDAARWQAQQSQSQLALKKVRAAPQISAPGARIHRDPAATQHSQARQAFHAKPSNQDSQLAYAESIARHLS